MKSSGRVGIIAGVAAGILALAVVGTTLAAGPGEGPVADPEPSGPVVMTELPGYTPASGEPQLASLGELRPAAGTVEQAEGPFDDRFELEELRFTPDSVSGAVDITSDVSEVLELQVLAGFYDASGALIGTGTWALGGTDGGDDTHDGPPEEHENFEILVPEELRGQAVAAAVGVPVLVNE